MGLKKLPLIASAVMWGMIFRGPSLAQVRGSDDWHIGSRMMGGWGMGWFGGIFMVILSALIIIGVVYLIKWLVDSSRTASKDTAGNASRALDILKERYARGEIDRKEFEEKKKDLLT